MGFTLIPNQPVKFLQPGEEDFNQWNQRCTLDPRTFCQIVSRDFQTMFQVQMEEANNTELVSEPDFAATTGWTFGTNWSHDAVNNEADHTSGASGELSAAGILTVGNYYKVVVSVRNITDGELEIRVGGTILATITANGTYSLYGTCTVDTDFDLEADSDFDGSVYYASVKLGSRVTGYLVQEGNPVPLASLTPSYYQGIAMMTVDWPSVVSDGTYRIYLFDDNAQDDNVVNDPDFDGSCGVDWICNANAAIASSELQLSAALNPGEATQGSGEGFAGVEASKAYALYVKVNAASESLPNEFQLSFYVNSTELHTMTDVSTAVGTHVFYFSGIAGDELIVSVNEYTDADLEFLYIVPAICSECFSLSDDHGCDAELVLIEATNYNNFLLSNGLRLEYENLALTLRMLVKGAINMQDFPYPIESQYKYSDGDIENEFVDSEELKELLIESIPPYMHRCIRIMLVHDIVTLNSERYVKEPGNYTPDIERDSKLAPVLVGVKEQNQRNINKLC